MRNLAPDIAVVVTSLPTPSSALAGAIVRLQTDSLPYWCDGAQWLPMTGNSGGPSTHLGAIAWPRRGGTPKIAGDVAGGALGTLALTAAQQYFVPFSVPRSVTLTGLCLSVTTALAGTASIGIYGNTVISGDDAPGGLLASAAGLNTGTTGDKTGTVSLTLQPGALYWASLIASAAVTVRALAVGSVQSSLGRTVNNTAVISYLFAAGSGSTMPATAPTTLSNGTGSVPAIYLVGS